MACGHVYGSTTVSAREWFPVEQGLRQGCVLATPPVQQHSSRRATHMAFTRFKADKAIMDALVGLKEKTGTGKAGDDNGRRGSPGDVTMEYVLLC